MSRSWTYTLCLLAVTVAAMLISAPALPEETLAQGGELKKREGGPVNMAFHTLLQAEEEAQKPPFRSTHSRHGRKRLDRKMEATEDVGPILTGKAITGLIFVFIFAGVLTLMLAFELFFVLCEWLRARSIPVVAPEKEAAPQSAQQDI